MKVLTFDRRDGFAKVVPESLDDLWHLSKIVESGDLAGAQTSRKVKYGGDQSKSSVSRIPCFIRVEVSDVELDFVASVLRIKGKVETGPEDVPLKSAHTLGVEINSIVEIKKDKWMKYQIDRLARAKVRGGKSVLLVCVLDDEVAAFAAISESGVKELGDISISLASKRTKVSSEDQYEVLFAALQNYFKQLGPGGIVIAGPSFWKDELFKVVKSKDYDLAKKVKLEGASCSGFAGVQELVEKGISKGSSLDDEEDFVKELNSRVARNGAVSYGFKDVINASSAIEKLGISEKFISESRKKGKYSEVEELVDSVEKIGVVLVVDSKSYAGKRLDGLGGIAALLRYKL